MKRVSTWWDRPNAVRTRLAVESLERRDVPSGNGLHDQILGILTSPDSNHLAFVAADGTRETLIADGRDVGNSHSRILAPRFSADSQHLLFIADESPTVNDLGPQL